VLEAIKPKDFEGVLPLADEVEPVLQKVLPSPEAVMRIGGSTPAPPKPAPTEDILPLQLQATKPSGFTPIEPVAVKLPPKQTEPPIVLTAITPPKYGAPRLTPLEASFKPRLFAKPAIGAPLGSVLGVAKAPKMPGFRFGVLEHPVADVSRLLGVKAKGGGGRRRRR
jgi:hypothetical protein